MIKILSDVNERITQSLGIVTPNSRAIEYDGILVGLIDFYVVGDRIKILYIRINDEYRRQGIACKVINMLKENHKGKYMYGDSLPGAINFWEKMGAEFEEDPDEDYLTPFHIEC